jgi:hypothetical protein
VGQINGAGAVTLRVAGRLRHIGVGRTYAGTYVYLLVQGLDVRVVHASTQSSSANSPSTHDATTNPPAHPRTHPEMTNGPTKSQVRSRRCPEASRQSG